jgi:ribosomal protein S18 acetylase RimI-like enzyme
MLKQLFVHYKLIFCHFFDANLSCIEYSLALKLSYPRTFTTRRNDMKAVTAEVVEVHGQCALDQVTEALARLIPQLSGSAGPSREDIEHLVHDDSSRLLVALVDGFIVGTLTLVRLRTVEGISHEIHCVVVDMEFRGFGVGKMLMMEALRLAAMDDSRYIDLTSRPEREAANRLYNHLGYERRHTNIYRFNMTR